MPPKLIAKSAVLAGIDTLNERREELTAKFFKRHVLASSSYCTAYSLTSTNTKPEVVFSGRGRHLEKWI